MDCWGLGAGCCLVLPLHSTLLGALIPRAYGRDGRAEGEKEMGDVGGGKGRGGRERRGEGGQLGTVTVVLLNGGEDQMCSSYTCQSHYSCQTGSPDTMPTGYWSKQSTCQYRPLLGYQYSGKPHGVLTDHYSEH